MEPPRLRKMIDALTAGEACGVFIDDTGSPGLEVPAGLHRDRKTWVAVILLPSHASEVMEQMPKFISEVENLTGAKECHFVDIFGGRRAFKGSIRN